jgi:hypothetical protein
VPQAGCAEQARLAMIFGQTARARQLWRGVIERQWTLKPLQDLLSCKLIFTSDQDRLIAFLVAIEPDIWGSWTTAVVRRSCWRSTFTGFLNPGGLHRTPQFCSGSAVDGDERGRTSANADELAQTSRCDHHIADARPAGPLAIAYVCIRHLGTAAANRDLCAIAAVLIHVNVAPGGGSPQFG